MPRKYCSIAVAVAALLVSGCSKYDASVDGMLLIDGQPATYGSVTFQRTEGGVTAYGMVDEDGSFGAQVGGERGLPSGNYRVGVRVAEEIPPENFGDPPGFKDTIPKRYKNPETSGFDLEITKGKNRIELEVSTSE